CPFGNPADLLIRGGRREPGNPRRSAGRPRQRCGDADDVRLARGQREYAPPAATDEDRRTRPLRRSWATFEASAPILRSLEIERRVGREQLLQQANGLGEPIDPYLHGLDGDPKGVVVVGQPARTQAQLDPPARQDV